MLCRGNSVYGLRSYLSSGLFVFSFMIIKTLVITLVIATLWYPHQASLIFISLAMILELYFLILPKIGGDRTVDICNFSSAEQEIFNRYYLYFKYPYASKSFASSLSLIALSALILTPWLLYNHFWLPGAVIAANYFLAQFISARLNIRFHLHDSVERLKREKLREEMDLVDSVCEKLSFAFSNG